MKDSSSWHALNADRGLPGWRAPAYLAANLCRNVMPGPRPRREFFAPEHAGRAVWDGFEPDLKATMARKWSNLFWATFPWEQTARGTGPLHILDIGCGRGGYGLRFASWAGDSLAAYRGVDPSPKLEEAWRDITKQDPRCTFIRAGAEQIGRALDEKTNIILSQSALEHIPGDVRLLADISRWAVTQKRPLVQIHLVPAALMLPIGLFHGIRQYPLRSIATLARACPGWDMQLFGLGGWASARLQRHTTKYPLPVRRLLGLNDGSEHLREPSYPDEAWAAFCRDRAKKSGPPLFWALVLSLNADSAIIGR